MPDLLKHPSFRILWVGRLASLFGTRFSDLALPWIILQSTNSPWKAGLVVAGQQAATLLLSIPAGVWVERQHKHRVAIISECLRFLAMLLLTLLVFQNKLSLWAVGLLQFFTGAAGLFFSAAYRPLLVFAIGRTRLQEAYNLNEGADAISTLLGPAAAGVVLVEFGPGWALAIDTFGCLISLVTLNIVRVREPEVTADREGSAKNIQAKWRDGVEGVLYILRNPIPRTLVGIGSLLGFATVASSLLITVLAQQRLHLNAAQAGWIYSAMGVGNVLGGLMDGALSVAFVVQASNVLVFTPDALLARVHTAAALVDDAARLIARLYSNTTALKVLAA